MAAGPFARRRDVLAFGAGAAAAAFAGRPRSARADQRTVGLAKASELGLVGDGRTDVAAALARAVNSGMTVDGQGQTFAVKGEVEAGAAFKGLVNANLIQLDPTGSRRRTLVVTGASDFVIENVSVVRGGDGGEPRDKAAIDAAGGVYIVRCRDFAIRGLGVGGGGIGSGVAILSSEGFSADDLTARDIRYRLDAHQNNDAIQGVWIAASSRFKLRNARVSDIGGVDKAWAVSDNNRGVAISGSQDFELSDVEVRRVGQGVDLTGSEGNSRFSIVRSTVEDCYSWGFKFANSAAVGRVEDAVARRCGTGGFVVSGPTQPKNPRPRDIVFARCLAEDTLGNFPRWKRSFGFGVTRTPLGAPRGVVFEDCVARADRLHCCMTTGFYNEAPAEMTEGEPNRVIRCRVEGPIETPFVGF